MYSIFMLFAALAVGAQVQALRTGEMRHWVLYGAADGGDDVDAVLRGPPDRRADRRDRAT